MTREFTAVIKKTNRWYVAYVEEIPGVNTQGRTLNETRRNLEEALRLILRTTGNQSRSRPAQHSVADEVRKVLRRRARH